MTLTYNIKQIGSFYRVSLYRNGYCFYGSALMTLTMAENFVTNHRYANVPTSWSVASVLSN